LLELEKKEIRFLTQLGVAYYKEEGLLEPKSVCSLSGEECQSQLHHDDLVDVMKVVGVDFGDHQNISLDQKRKLIATNT
jgi:hypothetical protein